YNVVLGFPAIRYLFLTPPDPAFDPLAFDFDRDPARTAQSAAIMDATSTDLSAFQARRGKILFYGGMSDPIFSRNDLVPYSQRLVPPCHAGGGGVGGLGRARLVARLFLVPGMNHCGGGPALDRFNPLTSLVEWVEKGHAPRQIVATGATFPGRSRPLCPYPEQ